MQYIKLGKTGLDVSPIAIGAMTYGEPGRGHPVWSLDEEQSRPLIKHALDAGINFFDTANMYSQGSSEEILGRALKDFADRDDVVIATKVRHPMRPGPNGAGLSRKAILTEIDHSLKRLGTDYVDLYQIHRMDHDDPARGDPGSAARRRQGGQGPLPRRLLDARLGVRQGPPPAAAQHGWARFVSMQDHYNLLAREEEREMLPLCADEGVGHDHLEPAGPRPPGPRERRVDDPLREQRLRLRRPALHRGSDATARSSTRWRRSPRTAASAGRRSPWPGCGATRSSSRRSSAPSTTGHIDDAVASLEIELTDDEIRALERPTPRATTSRASPARQNSRRSAPAYHENGRRQRHPS